MVKYVHVGASDSPHRIQRERRADCDVMLIRSIKDGVRGGPRGDGIGPLPLARRRCNELSVQRAYYRIATEPEGSRGTDRQIRQVAVRLESGFGVVSRSEKI